MKHSKWLVTLALSGVLAGFASAQTLQSVTTKKSGNGVEVTIAGTGLGKPIISRTKGNRSYVLHWNAKLEGRGGRQQVDTAGVDYVWHGWFDNRPPQVRVQLWLSDPNAEPKLEQNDNGWTVWVGDAAKPEPKKPVSSDPYKAVYEGESDKLPPLAFSNNGKLATLTHVQPTAVTPKSLNAALNAVGVNAPLAPAERLVSLDFVNTEVTLILKALASQANVNIVTSQDVAGKINVKLDNVPLQEALNFVTTIAGVRYTKIGKTFIVTSSARFGDAVRQVIGKLEEAGETRVIQLSSGEGKQIKAATLKAIPQLATDGFYDLILPTERIQSKTQSGTGSSTGTGEAAQGGGASSAQAASVETTAESKAVEGKDAYVVVVATAERLDEIVAFIKELDKRIATANSISGEGMATRVVPIYSPNADVIVDSVKSMVNRQPNAAAFKITLTNGGTIGSEEASKLLVIAGPADSLDMMEVMARATDKGIASALGVSVPESDADAKKGYEVVELKWIEPIEASTELESRVRGLSARMMPAYVDPNVKGSKKIGDTATTATATAGGTQTQTGDQSQGAATNQTAAQQSTESKVGSSMDKALGTEPMRLLLHGTRAQIDQAKDLLGVLDVEPKMVAIDLRVLDLSVDDAKKIGLDWGITTGGFIKNISLAGAFATGAGTISGNGTSRSTGFSIESILDAATTNGNLISRPNTIALDGKPTSIFVGDTIRYAEQIQATQNGVTVIVGKVDVGVTMNLVARVGADGTINMNLKPHLALLKGFTSFPNGGQVPQTSDRRLDSSVIMKSGDTIALGGLVQDSDRTTTTGIPFLKDLPIVGRLFRSESNNKIRTEVVFFITARVIERSNPNLMADPRNSMKNSHPDGAKIKP